MTSMEIVDGGRDLSRGYKVDVAEASGFPACRPSGFRGRRTNATCR